MTTESTATPPTPAGGTWTPGTYDLTSSVIYGTADGGDDGVSTRRETVVVMASGSDFTIQIAQVDGTTRDRSSGTATISSATQITFTRTCPPSQPDGGDDDNGTLGYTATGSSFTIFEQTRGGRTRVAVYTRRTGAP